MIYTKESREIIGAAIEVQKTLGTGFSELIYQEALEEEFSLRDIPFEREKELHVQYKGKTLKKMYKADFVCYGKIIVELKALDELCSEHKSQVINYLKVTGMQLGLLLNFGEIPLGIERLINL